MVKKKVETELLSDAVVPAEIETTPFIAIPVKVLSVIKKTALVEWVTAGEVSRGYIPFSKVSETMTVPESELHFASPYGVPWDSMLMIDPSNFINKLQKCLHNADIWTYEDARMKPQVVLGAIQAAYGFDLATVLATARKFEKGE